MADLILNLATQRCGSTYFDTGLARMGGLGRPWEAWSSVLPVLRAERDPAVLRSVFEAQLAERVDTDGQVGVTIMANYLSTIARAYLGPDVARGFGADELALWLAFWGEFRARFDRVFVFHLSRDPLDQAISQVLSERTGVGHVLDGVVWRRVGKVVQKVPLSEMGGGPVADHVGAAARIAPKFLCLRMARIVREDARLAAFAEAAGLQPLRVRYEVSTREPEQMARAIAAHVVGAARSLDFAPTTAKVVPKAASETIKARLVAWLQMDGADDASLSAAALAEGQRRDGRPLRRARRWADGMRARLS